MRRVSRLQAGDTIVEVMLAIAVIGMVLGASYATATRALRTGRAAQEQTEALKVAESQVELLKYIVTQNRVPGSSGDIFISTAGQNEFCIRDDVASFDRVAYGSSGYTAYCTGRSGLYTVLINYDGLENLFRVNVSWDQIGSNVKGNVQVSYRLYQ